MKAGLISLYFLVFLAHSLSGQVKEDTLRSSLDDITITALPLQTSFNYLQNELRVKQNSALLAATFDDPSRVLYRHAGISTSNDEANGIIYRGLPSSTVKWTVYGAEIVNPNHTSNAGTFDDYSSTSAGGVLSLPFEVIGTFKFSGSPLSSDKVNALSGIMDFEFGTEGNSFYKLGLLGMELGYQSQKKSGFKMHARYSTVGILTDFGVDFDGESIKFQDIFLESKLSEKISVFSILGSSLNHKDPLEDLSSVEILKDIQNIRYNSVLSIQGLHFEDKNHAHSLVFSHKDDDRIAVTDPELFVLDNPVDSSVFRNTRLSYSGSIRLNTKDEDELLKAGLNSSFVFEDFRQGKYKFKDPSFYVEPFITFRKLLNKIPRLSYEISMSSVYDSYLNEISLEPGISARYIHRKNTFSLNASYSGESQGVLIRAAGGNQLNRMKVMAISSSWKLRDVEKQLLLLGRIFFNTYSGLAHSGNYYPVINDYDILSDLEILEFSGSGSARNYGFEFMMDKSFSSKFNLNINTSLFRSEFKSINGNWIRSRYSFGHIVNLVISRKFVFKNDRSLFINLAFHQRGGTVGSSYLMADISDPENLKDFLRTDMRVQYNWKKRNQIVLDVQNLLNNENESYIFYDPYSEMNVIKYNLGMIPILSYKRIIGSFR